MKKKAFILIALAAVMLFASLSTSFAGYWLGFSGKTKWMSAFTELKRGTITDAKPNGQAGKAAVSVYDDSICFNAKIDLNVGTDNNPIWMDVTDELFCYCGDNGLTRTTILPYNIYISNGAKVRLWGRNRMTLYGGELMSGLINFN